MWGIILIRNYRLGLIVLLLLSVSMTIFCTTVSPSEANQPTAGMQDDIKQEKMEKHFIIVDKAGFKLMIYQGKSLIKEYAVATGKNEGDKQAVGDCRTPEGNFEISKIEDSRYWQYDFGDGKGPIRAYGKWFVRLETNADQTFSGRNWQGIGIHGTHDESSIGTQSSRGCLRMRNSDLEEFIEFLKTLPDYHLPVYIRSEKAGYEDIIP